MINQPYDALKNSTQFPRPLIITNIHSIQQDNYVCRKNVFSHEFFTISDGLKRVFTEEDGLEQYGHQKVLNPLKVAYMNLFINGVLQPKMNYEVEEGKLTILTEDIPLEGTPIILQMIALD